MNSEEKLLVAKINDLFRLCDKYQTPQFSDFLNEAECEIIKKNIGDSLGYNCCFFGGYENAQRAIFAIFCEWQEIDIKKIPIKVIEVTKKYDKELSHRDYLGTVLSTGIKREQVGDILVTDDGAYIFINSDLADYVSANLTKISNTGVRNRICDISEIKVPKPEFEIINTVCASKRIDAIIGGMLKISRKDSSNLILGEKVSVNHTVIKNISFNLKEEDIISVRGYGRFVYLGENGKTRSDRLHIKIKKYI